MKKDLNNTAILLSELNKTEIELAMELYSLVIPKTSHFKMDERSKYVGIYSNTTGYWVGDGIVDLKTITLHQLAFESGLNPEWANAIALVDNIFLWVESTDTGYISFACLDEQKKLPMDKAHKLKYCFVIEKTDCEKTDTAPLNSYEFIVRCKHTGKPVVVDYYAIAKALPNLSPEVSHSLKKIIQAGKRNGGKSYRQDIEESRNQLNQELKYLGLVEEN